MYCCPERYLLCAFHALRAASDAHPALPDSPQPTQILSVVAIWQYGLTGLHFALPRESWHHGKPSCKVLNFLDAQPMQPNINNAQVSLHYQPHEAITTTTYNSTAVMPPFPFSVRPTSFRAEFLEIILQKNLAKVAPMIDHQARPSLLAQIPDHCSIHGKRPTNHGFHFCDSGKMMKNVEKKGTHVMSG